MYKQTYTINETLEVLKISRATLYKQINKHKTQLKTDIYMEKGRTFITESGLNFLKQCIDNPIHCLDNKDNVYIQSKQHIDNNTEDKNSIINILQKEIELLKQQILEKDTLLNNQLKEKDIQIQTLSKLLENSQILLKHEQEQQTKMLTNQFINNNQCKEKPTIFQKIFGVLCTPSRNS